MNARMISFFGSFLIWFVACFIFVHPCGSKMDQHPTGIRLWFKKVILQFIARLVTFVSSGIRVKVEYDESEEIKVLYSEYLGPDWQEQVLAKQSKNGQKINKRCTVVLNHASPLDTWLLQCVIPDSCGAYAAVGKLFEFWN